MEKGFVIEIVISLVEIPPIKYSTFNLKNFWETKFTRIYFASFSYKNLQNLIKSF